MQKCIRNSILLLSALLLACSHPDNLGDTTSLSGLQNMSYSKKKPKIQRKASTSKMRVLALKETALSLGAQSGLAWRAKYIDNELIRQAKNLDAIYNFNSLLLEHNVLPPVLVEGRNTLNLADTQTIRISDHTFKVIKQARFITTPPNWRQYLWMDYKAPPKPHVALLPKK